MPRQSTVFYNQIVSDGGVAGSRVRKNEQRAKDADRHLSNVEPKVEVEEVKVETPKKRVSIFKSSPRKGTR